MDDPDDPDDHLLRSREWLHRYAVWLSRNDRDLLTADEARAVADLAIVHARNRFSVARKVEFASYARRWVLGAIRRSLAREVRQRAIAAALLPFSDGGGPPAFLGVAEGANPYQVCLAREVLGDLDTGERAVFVAHAVGGETLAGAAERSHRHRAWAVRKHRSARDRLRRRHEREAG